MRVAVYSFAVVGALTVAAVIGAAYVAGVFEASA